MKEKDILLEELADFMHISWSHWMKYFFSKVEIHYDPDYGYAKVVIHEDDYLRWKRQIQTPYSELTEKEKDSDREWARKVLDIITTKDARKSLKEIEKIRKDLETLMTQFDWSAPVAVEIEEKIKKSLNKLESELYKFKL